MSKRDVFALQICYIRKNKGLWPDHGNFTPSMGLSDILIVFEKKIPGYLGAAVGAPDESPATLHSEERFPAASLIKVPILMHLLKQNDLGVVDLQETVALQNKDKVSDSGVLLELHEGILLTLLDLATLMIVVSDNTATNLLMDRLGTEKIQAFIQEIGMKHTVLARKLMIAPNAPPANFTSPSDMHVLFLKLLQGKLLTPNNASLALAILSRQQYNEKIPLLLPRETKVAHKTGEISGVRHDCGIIDPDHRRIIICLLTKNDTNELEVDRGLAELSLEAYRYYAKT